MAETTVDRGGLHPPFEPGNSHAIRHGVHASVDRIDRDPRSAEIEARVIQLFPWLHEPVFEDALVAYRRTQVRIERAHAWLDEHGDYAKSGKVKDVAKHLDTLERLARDLRADLGLSPAAATKLSRNLFASHRDKAALEAHLAEGRRLRLEAEARLGLTNGHQASPQPPDDASTGPGDVQEPPRPLSNGNGLVQDAF